MEIIDLFNDEQLELLIALGQVGERVREERARSQPSSPSTKIIIDSHPAKVIIDSQDELHFKGAPEPVEVERLVRIIVNASKNAVKVAEYVRSTKREEFDSPPPILSIPHSAAMRYAATLRDSLSSLGILLGADEHYVQRTPKWTELELIGHKPTVTPNWADSEEEVTGQSRIPLEYAKIYMELKTVREKLYKFKAHTAEITDLYTKVDKIMKGISNGEYRT